MAALLLSALTVNTLTSIDLFNKDKTAYVYKGNSVLAAALGVEVESRLASDLKIMHLIGSHLSASKKLTINQTNAIESLLRNAADIVSLDVYSTGSNKTIFHKHRMRFIKENYLEDDFFSRLKKERPVSFLDIKKHGIVFDNATLPDGAPLLSVGITSRSKNQNEDDIIAVAKINLNRFLRVFSKEQDHTTYLLDQSGRILVHPDIDRVTRHDDLTGIEFINRIISSKIQTGAEEFKDDEGEIQIGAYRRLGLGGLTVVSQIPKEKAFLASRKLFEKSISFGLMVVFVALFLCVILSRGLLSSLRKLHQATRKIGRGDFKVAVKINQKDEIGDLAHSINTMAVEIITQIDHVKDVSAQKEKVKSAFGRYLNPAIVEKILEDPKAMKLGGEKKDISMFFSDVRDFTPISEMLTPTQLTDCLNRYMTKMTDILFAHQGTLERYVGDAIVAFWGAPLEVKNHAYQSVKAAIAMLQAMPELNKEFKKLKYPEFRIGIGINSGEVSVGNMGSEQIMAYTALGDNMNLAARLESLCKHYNAKLLISDLTLKAMGDLAKEFNYRVIDHAQVKGKKKAVHIIEVIDSTYFMHRDPQSLQDFSEAFGLYERQEFTQALKIFKSTLNKYPFDASSKRMIAKVENLQVNPPGKDWSAITVHDKK